MVADGKTDRLRGSIEWLKSCRRIWIDQDISQIMKEIRECFPMPPCDAADALFLANLEAKLQ